MSCDKKITVSIYLLHASSEQVTDKDIEALASTLKGELFEKQKYTPDKGFRRDRILAYTALMYALFKEGLDPDEVTVTFTEKGKPIIPGTSYRISVSHDGGVGAVAISSTADVGIDIERLSEKTLETLTKVCDRFVPNFKPQPNALTSFIYEEDTEPAPSFEIKLYELLPTKPFGKLYFGRVASPTLYQSREGSNEEKWTCAEALLKLDGRGFAAFSEIEELRESASLYSCLMQPTESTVPVAISLAMKITE